MHAFANDWAQMPSREACTRQGLSLNQYLTWYYDQYHEFVPSLNITFTEDELDAVRAAAAGDDVSLRTFAHRAVLAAASEHKRRVAEAARIVAERSAELNRRLA